MVFFYPLAVFKKKTIAAFKKTFIKNQHIQLSRACSTFKTAREKCLFLSKTINTADTPPKKHAKFSVSTQKFSK